MGTLAHPGSEALLKEMRASRIPLTRTNYLNLAYMGEVPDDLGPELLAQLPDGLED